MVFSTLSIEHAWASVILAKKRDIRRHSSTGLSEIVAVAETSNRLVIGACLSLRQRLPLGNKLSVVRSFSRSYNSFRHFAIGRGLAPSIKVRFMVKQGTIKHSGVSFFDNTRKNFKSNLVLFVLETWKTACVAGRISGRFWRRSRVKIGSLSNWNPSRIHCQESAPGITMFNQSRG